jgi:hypothetical protein
MAKIMECGAQCAIPLAPNDSLLGTIRSDHFLVRPLAKHRICTPDSVAAHTMYEQGNPHILYEPEGDVDMTGGRFRAGGRADGARLGLALHPDAAAAHQARGRAPRGLPRLHHRRHPRPHRDREPPGDRGDGARRGEAQPGGVPEATTSSASATTAATRAGAARARSRSVPHEVGAWVEASGPHPGRSPTPGSRSRDRRSCTVPSPGRKTTCRQSSPFPHRPRTTSGRGPRCTSSASTT